MLSTFKRSENTQAGQVRRDHEDLRQLLMRLEAAIDLANEDEDFIDQINNGSDDRI